MVRTLGKQEVEEVLYGATLLGAGGGGSLRDGLRLLSEVAQGEVRVEMVNPKEMGPNEYAVMVAGIGAPRAMQERHFGPEACYAFEAIKKVAFLGGKNIKYVMAGELGGFNTMVPMYVAISKGIPFVNGDGNGRAVPELNTGLYPAFDIPPTPLVLAGNNGDVVFAYLNDPRNHKSAENIARHFSIAYGMSAAFSTWIVDSTDICEKLAPKSIENCQAIGAAIKKAKNNKTDVIEEIRKALRCKELFRGKITKIQVKTEGGFDFGTTEISGTGEFEGSVYRIDFKNENLLVRNGENKVLATVPDLICLVDLDKREPLTNAETEEGLNVSVVGVPAPENWWKKPEGFRCWEHILRKVGYEGGPVRVL